MAATLVVTGAAGFLGARVLGAGLTAGAEVVGLVRACEPRPQVAGARIAEADWASAATLAAALADARPDAIVHCAGHNGRFAGAPDLETLYDANVGAVWRVLQAARLAAPAARVVLVSSAAVYDRAAPPPVAEDAALAPASHYGVSKLAAEQVALGFAAGDGPAVCVARTFNVVGPGEPPGSVTYELASQALAVPPRARARVRLVETASVRDFVDVDDVAGALVTLAGTGARGGVYNVCRGEGVAIATLVERAARVWDRPIDLELAAPQAAGSVSIGDPSRLRALGWLPTYDLDAILARTAGAAT